MSLDYRQKGFDALDDGDYPAAINHFTNALRNNHESVLHSARAKCYYLNACGRGEPEAISNQAWKKIEADCVAALEYDPQNYEAQYYQGLHSLYQEHDYPKAVKQLDSALRASMTAPKRFRNCEKPSKIHEALNDAKEYLKRSQEDAVVAKRVPLYSKLARLLQQDYQDQIDTVRRKDVNDDIRQYKLTQLAMQYREDSQDLHTMFASGFGYTARQKVEVPDCFIDRITEEIFHDPVCTPSGVSYERSSLFKHIEQNGLDPLTRHKLTKDQCYPNVELRKAVEQWRKEHEPDI
ncbi:hypothetical protein DIURU_004650 [Diutina rugosa]|uniref:RING-type E3 ubiquitin transferase n=1 Tax=Diutina rugosa TaxID=5481 RepID=A0A642UGL4_DIURU|nr:uncharacterized protein DIURU_004650 [Diutina rugosa]KAA8898530.1 hypothetical protein DIURU_004650 [Diutina rugosa]